MSTQPPIPPPSLPTSPSWIELSQFIQAQNEAGRAVIDRWFTLAVWVLGLLVVAISIGLGLFGWKTFVDVKATAQDVARSTAKEVATSEAKKAADEAASAAATEQVKLIMQDPHVQKLVSETAAQLFRQGAYRQTVENAVHKQMQSALMSGVAGDYVVSVNGVPNQRLKITKKLTGTSGASSTTNP